MEDDASRQHQVTWIGTSISKVLDKKKFEKDAEVKVSAVKAYCVNEEGRFPKSNFKAIVPEVVSKGQTDTLILETGSIEISNIDVNKALMDPRKDINKYKKEWFAKAEEVSTELFKLAEDAVANDDKLHVVILKRLPRFDRSANDLINIKSNLSEFANMVYDQLWIQRGSPERIHIVDIQLVKNGGYLRDLIYGTPENSHYDGIHLNGSGASRQFTYRVIQALKPVIAKPNINPKTPYIWRQNRSTKTNNSAGDYHLSCPQAVYMSKSSTGRLSEKTGLKGSSQQKTKYSYSVPTENFFNPLN